MSNWNVRRRIVATFAAIIAIMLVLGVVSYDRLRRIDEAAAAIEADHMPGVILSSQANALARDLLPAVLTRATSSDAKSRAQAAATVDDVLARERQIDTAFARTIAADSERGPFRAMVAARERFSAVYQSALADGSLSQQEVETDIRPAIDQSPSAPPGWPARGRAS